MIYNALLKPTLPTPTLYVVSSCGPGFQGAVRAYCLLRDLERRTTVLASGLRFPGQLTLTGFQETTNLTDTVFKGSRYPPHSPRVRWDARTHRLKKTSRSQNSSGPSLPCSHKVWLECILHLSRLLQGRSTDLSQFLSPPPADPLPHLPCKPTSPKPAELLTGLSL